MMKTDEDQILNSIRLGGIECESALLRLYDDIRPMAIRHVRQNNGSKEEAIDLLQDTVIAFYSAVVNNRFEGKSSIKTYIYSIIKNLWLKSLNKKKNVPGHQKHISDHTPNSFIKDNLTSSEIKNQMESIFNLLGTQCKEVLIKFYFYSYSMKEICTSMHFENEQVVRNKKYKCLKKLKKMIEGKENIIRSILSTK